MKYFDCNAMIGRYMNPHPSAFFTKEELLKEMDGAGIEEAVVYHSFAPAYRAEMGNQILMEELKDCRRLHPAWVVIPHHTGEMEKPNILVDEMAKNRVRMARLFFGAFCYTPDFDLFVYGDLLEALQERRIPLMMEYSSGGDYPYDIPTMEWKEIGRACKDFPDLPIILSGFKTTHWMRRLCALWEKFENLYLVIDGFQNALGVENLCRRFGTRRLLFGTHMPYRAPEPTIIMINYAKISPEEKMMIVGGNLRSLFRGIKG